MGQLVHELQDKAEALATTRGVAARQAEEEARLTALDHDSEAVAHPVETESDEDDSDEDSFKNVPVVELTQPPRSKPTQTRQWRMVRHQRAAQLERRHPLDGASERIKTEQQADDTLKELRQRADGPC